jgi:hypothetical protein
VGIGMESNSQIQKINITKTSSPDVSLVPVLALCDLKKKLGYAWTCLALLPNLYKALLQL